MKNTLFFLFLLAQLISNAQGGTEIVLFDMQIKNGEVVLKNGKNVTNHKGYDNQPFFYKDNLYFSSGDDNQMDIKVYDVKKNSTATFTNTIDNEFSPTLTPDKKFISCILQQKDQTQDLVKYPLKGGLPTALIENLSVGYHAWIDKSNLLLFILEDSATFNLHHYNVKTKADKVVAKNIGRSLHKIPGTNAMSFIEKVSDNEWLIKKYDPSTNVITTIIKTLPKRDNLAWTTNGVIIMSDGKDIFSFQPGKSTAWTKVIIDNASLLKGITRLAVNDKNNKVAVVVAE
jgi:hypothetical protein